MRKLEVMLRQESQPIEGREWWPCDHMDVSELQGFMEKHKLDEVTLHQGASRIHYRWVEEPSDDEKIVDQALEVMAFLTALEEAHLYDISKVLPAAKNAALWLNDHIPCGAEETLAE